MKNGAGIPIMKIPDNFTTANPSTLLVDIETTINEIINPINDVNTDIPTIISKEKLINENINRITTVTTNDIIAGNPNLEIKYPLLSSGVTAIYLEIPSSISPRIIIDATKQNIIGVIAAKSKSNIR